MNDFSRRLQHMMDENLLQAVDIVTRSNGYITKSNVSQWLNNRCKPSSKKIAVLSDIFNCNPNYLLGLTDDPTPPNLEQLTNEAKLCDLMSKCYGRESYRIVKLYLTLNEEGRKAAFKRVEELTRLEEYVKRDQDAGRKAI